MASFFMRYPECLEYAAAHLYDFDRGVESFAYAPVLRVDLVTHLMGLPPGDRALTNGAILRRLRRDGSISGVAGTFDAVRWLASLQGTGPEDHQLTGT